MSIRLNKRAVIFATGVAVALLGAIIVLAVMKSRGPGACACYIVPSENLVSIDLSKSSSTEFAVTLANSPVSDFADEFSFSCFDSDRNKLDDSPVEVSELKAGKNNGYCTATVSAQKEGLYLVRCSHPLAEKDSYVIVAVKAEEKKPGYIVTSEDPVAIDLGKSDCAKFGIILGGSPVADYADGFSFSYLDLDGNALDDPPVKVTGVKAGKKNGWCTAAVSAQREGVCFIRVSHKLARFSDDVRVVVRKDAGEEFQGV